MPTTPSPTIKQKQDDIPNRAIFFKHVVRKIPDKWWEFGVVLSDIISNGELRAIDRNKKPEQCFIDIFHLCISQPHFTWKTVLKALQDMGENTLYHDLIHHQLDT